MPDKNPTVSDVMARYEQADCADQQKYLRVTVQDNHALKNYLVTPNCSDRDADRFIGKAVDAVLRAGHNDIDDMFPFTGRVVVELKQRAEEISPAVHDATHDMIHYLYHKEGFEHLTQLRAELNKVSAFEPYKNSFPGDPTEWEPAGRKAIANTLVDMDKQEILRVSQAANHILDYRPKGEEAKEIVAGFMEKVYAEIKAIGKELDAKHVASLKKSPGKNTGPTP